MCVYIYIYIYIHLYTHLITSGLQRGRLDELRDAEVASSGAECVAKEGRNYPRMLPSDFRMCCVVFGKKMSRRQPPLPYTRFQNLNLEK